MRRSFTPNVRLLKEAGDIDGLVEAFGHREVVTAPDGRRVDRGARSRREALEALVELDDRCALEPLVRGLSDDDEAVRRVAVEALAARPDDSAIEALAAGVGSWSVPLEDPTRGAALAALFRRWNERLPYAVAAAMMNRPDEDPLGEPDRSCLSDLLGVPAAEGASEKLSWQLLPSLAHEREAVRGRAEQVLAWLGSDALDALLAALCRSEVAATAARILGQVRDERALAALIELAADRDADVRREVAASFGEIKDPRSVQALVALSYDADRSTREAAFHSLDRLGTAAVVIATTNAQMLLGQQSPSSAALPATQNGSSVRAELPPGEDAASGAPHASRPGASPLR